MRRARGERKGAEGQRREKDWQWESSSAAESKAVRAQGPQHSIFQAILTQKSQDKTESERKRK